MAGGVKKPVNIFNLKNLGEPEGVFNWRLWFAVVSFGLLGAARGVDEGLISGAFKSKDFQRFIHYENYDHGTFWCFAAVTIIGGIWVWFFVPETGGRSLESMDRLFDLPWYRIGLFGNKDAEEQDAIYDEKAEAAEHNIGQSEHAEKRDERKEIA
ncbi:hypothetical protein BN1708_014499, partial [Verticillium longisporum]